jgi:hypothetical protein
VDDAEDAACPAGALIEQLDQGRRVDIVRAQIKDTGRAAGSFDAALMRNAPHHQPRQACHRPAGKPTPLPEQQERERATYRRLTTTPRAPILPANQAHPDSVTREPPVSKIDSARLHRRGGEAPDA